MLESEDKLYSYLSEYVVLHCTYTEEETLDKRLSTLNLESMVTQRDPRCVLCWLAHCPYRYFSEGKGPELSPDVL